MFMLAGPNGAGKSTLYETRIKPHTAAPFINADLIQRDELLDPSMQASYRAAELADARRREHLSRGVDFVSESTFSHPSKLELISAAKSAGFRVVLYHVNLRSPELSVFRVARRYEEGGHDVPEDKVRARFARSPELIRQAVLLSDRAYVYDNSRLNVEPALALRFRDGHVVQISGQVPAWARELYSKELEPFSQSLLNPAAASFADAKAIASRLVGAEADVRVAQVHRSGVAYSGLVVGETALHWLQREESGEFVAHFKANLPSDIALRRDYLISYGDRGRATTELRQDPGLVSPDGGAEALRVSARNKLVADAFLRLAPEEAVRAHPGLAGAYAVLASVEQRAKNMNEVDRATALAHAKAYLANGIERGETPSFSPQVELVRRGTGIER